MAETATAIRRSPVWSWIAAAVLGCLLVACGAPADRKPGPTSPQPLPGVGVNLPYEGTNYYAPVSDGCPLYTSWTPGCYGDARKTLVADMDFLSRQGGGRFQRIWISLDQLFSCFDPTTGFCGYDSGSLGNVLDALRVMAAAGERADVVLLVQSSGPSDRNTFHFEALDGRHAAMRQGYLDAAEQFVERVAEDRIAASAVAVVDMENEGYFQNRRALLGANTACGADGGCIDRTLSKPFFDDLYRRLKGAASQFLYTVSSVTGQVLGDDMSYWLGMYQVDIYDIHVYLSSPEQHTQDFARARELPKPWFVGEAGPSNDGDRSRRCYVYNGDDPCTVSVDTWLRRHLGPDYGARSVLIENGGTVFQHSKTGPKLTATGRAVAEPSAGSAGD